MSSYIVEGPGFMSIQKDPVWSGPIASQTACMERVEALSWLLAEARWLAKGWRESAGVFLIEATDPADHRKFMRYNAFPWES